MGYIWVNNTATGMAPSPDFGFLGFFFTLLIALIVPALIILGLYWVIREFFEWLTDRIAEKVVEKMKREGE